MNGSFSRYLGEARRKGEANKKNFDARFCEISRLPVTGPRIARLINQVNYSAHIARILARARARYRKRKKRTRDGRFRISLGEHGKRPSIPLNACEVRAFVRIFSLAQRDGSVNSEASTVTIVVI